MGGEGGEDEAYPDLTKVLERRGNYFSKLYYLIELLNNRFICVKKNIDIL